MRNKSLNLLKVSPFANNPVENSEMPRLADAIAFN